MANHEFDPDGMFKARDRTGIKNIPVEQECEQCGEVQPSENFRLKNRNQYTTVEEFEKEPLEQTCKDCHKHNSDLRKMGIYSLKNTDKMVSGTLVRLLLQDKAKKLIVVCEKIIEQAGKGDKEMIKYLIMLIQGTEVPQKPTKTAPPKPQAIEAETPSESAADLLSKIRKA